MQGKQAIIDALNVLLANELAQKGVKVVALEAGGRYLPEDYINDEWDSFAQLAWLDARTTSGDWRVAKDFAGLPAWIGKPLMPTAPAAFP